MGSCVLDLIKETGDDVFDFFNFISIVRFVEVGEAIDLIFILTGDFKGRDIVILYEAKVVNEDVDSFDELLDGYVFASFFIIVKEAIADEEM